MKCLTVRIASLFLCLQFLIPTAALAAVFPDREIRLLAVSANGTSTAKVIEQLNYLDAHWPGSDGVTINLLNGGVPVPLGGAVLTGSALNQLNQAKARTIWNQYRATWGADLMIVFTPSMSGADCGRVVQYNWTSVDDPIPGLFVPDPSNLNLDLRGASNGYAASVEASVGCPVLTAAHELAHLLGSGHTYSVAAGKYLTNTSHGVAYVITSQWGTGGFKTIEAQGSNPPECVTAGVTCQYLTAGLYSSGFIVKPPDPIANTLATFETTALSVANYFAGSGGGGGGGGSGGQHPQCNDGIDNDGDGKVDYPNDPDCASLGDDNESDSGGGGGGGGCGLQVPSNLVATFVGACVPDPWTQYTVTWTDTCPSAAHSYEIYYRQPATSGIWKFGWKSFVPSTPAFVTGADSRLRVRACGLSGCSGYSSTVLLLDAC